MCADAEDPEELDEMSLIEPLTAGTSVLKRLQAPNGDISFGCDLADEVNQFMNIRARMESAPESPLKDVSEGSPCTVSSFNKPDRDYDLRSRSKLSSKVDYLDKVIVDVADMHADWERVHAMHTEQEGALRARMMSVERMLTRGSSPTSLASSTPRSRTFSKQSVTADDDLQADRWCKKECVVHDCDQRYPPSGKPCSGIGFDQNTPFDATVLLQQLQSLQQKTTFHETLLRAHESRFADHDAVQESFTRQFADFRSSCTAQQNIVLEQDLEARESQYVATVQRLDSFERCLANITPSYRVDSPRVLAPILEERDVLEDPETDLRTVAGFRDEGSFDVAGQAARIRKVEDERHPEWGRIDCIEHLLVDWVEKNRHGEETVLEQFRLLFHDLHEHALQQVDLKERLEHLEIVVGDARESYVPSEYSCSIPGEEERDPPLKDRLEVFEQIMGGDPGKPGDFVRKIGSKYVLHGGRKDHDFASQEVRCPPNTACSSLSRTNIRSPRSSPSRITGVRPQDTFDAEIIVSSLDTHDYPTLKPPHTSRFFF